MKDYIYIILIGICLIQIQNLKEETREQAFEISELTIYNEDFFEWYTQDHE